MSKKYKVGRPMRIQARRGSRAEELYYKQSALPEPWPMPEAIANGVSPRPLEDLIFHGGKIVRRCASRMSIWARRATGQTAM